jgi:hypothetical protein
MVMYTDGFGGFQCCGRFLRHQSLCDLVTRTRDQLRDGGGLLLLLQFDNGREKQDDDLTVLICDYTPKNGKQVLAGFAPQALKSELVDVTLIDRRNRLSDSVLRA